MQDRYQKNWTRQRTQSKGQSMNERCIQARDANSEFNVEAINLNETEAKSKRTIRAAEW